MSSTVANKKVEPQETCAGGCKTHVAHRYGYEKPMTKFDIISLRDECPVTK